MKIDLGRSRKTQQLTLKKIVPFLSIVYSYLRKQRDFRLFLRLKSFLTVASRVERLGKWAESIMEKLVRDVDVEILRQQNDKENLLKPDIKHKHKEIQVRVYFLNWKTIQDRRKHKIGDCQLAINI